MQEAAGDRDRWSFAKLRAWQEEQLAIVLERARHHVPYYRDLWQRRSDTADYRKLSGWPILSKTPVRLRPNAFLDDRIRLRTLQVAQTSGTTGTPLQVWHTRATARQWYALTEARWRGWYGVSRRDRWAILGGQLITPIEQRRPPYWIWNAGLRQLYLSSYHLSAESCASYLRAIEEHQVVYLWGYASTLYSLAILAREQQLRPPSLKVIVSNAELLPTYQRDVIQSFFCCPVRDTYGMTEMVAAAGECEHGSLHLWPEAGIVEVIADDCDEPVPAGTVGRLICTGLLNAHMPLIRFDLGDRGAMADPVFQCRCGRALPVLHSVDGREEDLVITPDHRRIGRLDSIFKSEFPIRESQIIQESPSSLRVKIVPDENYTATSGERICQAVRDRVGAMTVGLELVEKIPRGENGKFRAVISYLDERSLRSSLQPRPSHSRRRLDLSLPLRVYHSLPPFARNWAAFAQGVALRRKRYSRETTLLAEEALTRDGWSSDQWRRWQHEQLAEVLARAASKVPYYRNYWASRSTSLSSGFITELGNWPLLRKEVLRTSPESILSDDWDKRRMETVTTSGTTGTPITLWRSRETNRRWYAINEARVRLWNGVSQQDRWGHIGGQPVVPFEQRRPPYWVWNGALNQLYLSCMHLGPDSCLSYLEAIQSYRLVYLLGYASSIAMLARAAIDCGMIIPLRCVITDSEPLTLSQRTQIERAFACPVRETYGMAEIVCGASECSAGKLHLWLDAGIVELLGEDDQPAAPGQVGRIVATGLLNPDMPLVRYDTQDLAQAETDESPCSCGCTLPRIRKLFGRNDDVVITADGRRIVQVDRILDPHFDLKEAQIVQDAIGRFRIRIVPGKRWNPVDGTQLCNALRALVGEADIVIDPTTAIEKTWAGKHRIIVSHVSNQDRMGDRPLPTERILGNA